MKQQTRGSLMLLLCAMVWGAAFVAQSEGMNYVGPFTMQATRYFLSGLVLLPVIALRDKKGISVRPAGKAAKRQLLCGVICGVLLCTASIIQQYGIIHTTVGKSGFITTMYIILVPFLGLFVKLRVKLMNWVCAVLALGGLYLLCAGGEGLSAVNTGDWLTLLCAVFFACHILFIDRACHDLDGVRLSCVQFFTASAISILPMLLLEKPNLAAIGIGLCRPVWLDSAASGAECKRAAWLPRHLYCHRHRPASFQRHVCRMSAADSPANLTCFKSGAAFAAPLLPYSCRPVRKCARYAPVSADGHNFLQNRKNRT